MEQVVVAQSELLTCISCRMQFSDNVVMREHYKSEFHRFNLKRKAAGLPSVSQELFDQKVAASLAPKQTTKGKGHLKKPDQEKKEKPAEKEQTEEYPLEFEKSEEQIFAERAAKAIKLTLEDSLFDEHKSSSVDENLQYMSDKYSFFIPSIDHLSDLAGLMDYLGQKITVGYQCLFCDKPFDTMEGARRHMIHKSHCMMQWGDPTEYEEFFKFPKRNTVAQLINEVGELEESDLAYIEPGTGQLVLTGGDKNKVLGLRQYTTYYKQRNHRYVSHQLTSSLMQEHKRLAAIEYQKRVNNSVQYHEDRRHRIRKQANMIFHFRDQNGAIL